MGGAPSQAAGQRAANRGVQRRQGCSSADIQLQSALVCPLMVGDDVIGTIAVYHHGAESYTDDHRRVLDQVARQAAAVVHNTLLFERTQEQAFKDALTGLANPRALQFQVARELARARRTSSPFSLVLLDLDDFKVINDEYGHLAGDRALQEVARVLQQTTRPYDTCIRYGGDEFVVLLSSCGALKPKSSAAVCRKPLRQSRCAPRMAVKSHCASAPAPASFLRMVRRTNGCWREPIAGCTGTKRSRRRRFRHGRAPEGRLRSLVRSFPSRSEASVCATPTETRSEFLACEKLTQENEGHQLRSESQRRAISSSATENRLSDGPPIYYS